MSLIPCKRLQDAMVSLVILKGSCISTPVCENLFWVRMEKTEIWKTADPETSHT